jgi:hypothetical protein
MWNLDQKINLKDNP